MTEIVRFLSLDEAPFLPTKRVAARERTDLEAQIDHPGVPGAELIGGPSPAGPAWQPLPRLLKAAIDVTLAALILLLTAPLFLLICVACRLDGGTTLFTQARVGAGGRTFGCLKFRTMVMNADVVLREALMRDPALAAEWTATRKLRNDPRVTRVGRILRKTSLDELPQLINVLRLEMSLVGPRPIVVSEVALYGDGIAQYYATRPGLTGLWQVSGRSNVSYDQRVELDVHYVNHWTLWTDILLLMKTIPAVLAREGAY